MPLFETPKPRQFRYKPRFYDPEKERWEALKQKYADQRLRAKLIDDSEAAEVTSNNSSSDIANDADLEYFQKRVRDLDRQKSGHLTWKDLFRKREMPRFNYQPRFSNGETPSAEKSGTAEHIAEFKNRGIKIRRRFSNDSDDDNSLKPVPAGRIMLYALLTTLLLYWILF